MRLTEAQVPSVTASVVKKLVKRMMDVTSPLCWVDNSVSTILQKDKAVQQNREETHMLPVRKVRVKPTFIFLDICSLQISGSGMTKITTSVMMFGRVAHRK